jgi:hypothetical protein
MNVAMFVYAFLLFFVLTPGILLSLPPKGSKVVVALTHAFVFALVWHFTNKMVWKATSKMFEGMNDMTGMYNSVQSPAADMSTM